MECGEFGTCVAVALVAFIGALLGVLLSAATHLVVLSDEAVVAICMTIVFVVWLISMVALVKD